MERDSKHRNFVNNLRLINESILLLEENRIWHLRENEIERRNILIAKEAEILRCWGNAERSYPHVAAALDIIERTNGYISKDDKVLFATAAIRAVFFPSTKDVIFKGADKPVYRIVTLIRAGKMYIRTVSR